MAAVKRLGRRSMVRIVQCCPKDAAEHVLHRISCRSSAVDPGCGAYGFWLARDCLGNSDVLFLRRVPSEARQLLRHDPAQNKCRCRS